MTCLFSFLTSAVSYRWRLASSSLLLLSFYTAFPPSTLKTCDAVAFLSIVLGHFLDVYPFYHVMSALKTRGNIARNYNFLFCFVNIVIALQVSPCKM